MCIEWVTRLAHTSFTVDMNDFSLQPDAVNSMVKGI